MSSHGPGCEMADTPLACSRKTPAHYLMCGTHWRQVPITVQRRVYAGLAEGVGSTPYQQAVADAVQAVLRSAGIREASDGG